MIALRFHGKADVRLDEIEVPKPAPDEILVKVRACGICASDRRVLHHPPDRLEYTPVTMGHEASLQVVELGADVQGDRNYVPLKCGDIITIEDVYGCQRCFYCKRGMPSLCPTGKFPGFSAEGFFATYQVAKWHAAHKEITGLSDIELACVEPASVGLHAVRNGGVKLGDTVAVIGCGPIGMFELQAAKIAGACKIIMIDVIDWKLKVAEELGADIALNAKEVDVKKYVFDETGNIGVDVVFEAVGKAATIRDALRIVRKRGTVVVTGLLNEDVPIDFSSPLGITRREITVRGSICYSSWPDSKSDYDEVMGLIKQARLQVQPLVTHKFPLREWREAFNVSTDKCIKVMFTDLE